MKPWVKPGHEDSAPSRTEETRYEERGRPMLETGQVVYAKKVRNTVETNKPGYLEVGAKGHFICLLIGALKEKQGSIGQAQFSRLLGAASLASFDDIALCLGDDACNKLIEYIDKKYPNV
jgi:hypothetical protein